MSVVSRTSRRTVEAIRPPTGTQPRALSSTLGGELRDALHQRVGTRRSQVRWAVAVHDVLHAGLEPVARCGLTLTAARDPPPEVGLHLGYTSVTCCFYWQQCLLDMQEVTGSIPVSPTILKEGSSGNNSWTLCLS